jgi:peptidoglycan/LPS O-acetylase OafA/YrhL
VLTRSSVAPVEEPPKQASVLRHRADVQGLRAVAVLLVVLNHVGIGVVKGGYIGVDVFFVVSGFLITGLLLRDADVHGRVRWQDFYARRARRLLPAATLTLVATGVAGVCLLNFIRAQALLHDSAWAAFFSANVRFARVGSDYFNRDLPASPLQHFWSLAVEEQFYLVWPLLLSLTLFGRRTFERSVRRRRSHQISTGRLVAVLVAIIAVSLTWSVLQTNSNRPGAYFSTLTRAWELAAGALLAVLASRRAIPERVARHGIIGWLGIAAIGAAAVLYGPGTAFPGFAAVLPVVGAGLILVGGLWSNANGPGRLLSLRPMTIVGDVSYGFYLIHWPLLVIARQHAGHDLGLATNLELVGIAFGAAVLSYYALENPLRRPGRLMRWEPSDGLALWPISIMCLTLMVTWGLGNTRTASVTQILAASAAKTPITTTTLQPPGAGQSAGTVDGSVPGTPLPADPAPAPKLSPVETSVTESVRLARVGAPLPGAMQPSFTELENGERADPRRVEACQTPKDQSAGKLCRQGAVGSSKKLVLLGNSHAGMWTHVFQAIAKQSNYEFVPLIKDSCGVENYSGLQSMEACQPWFEWAVSQVERLHADVVVLAITYTPLWANGTAAALAQLTTRSPRVVFLGDVPGLEKRPADCLLASNATMSSCTFKPLGYFPKANAAAPTVARAAGVQFIDTESWFCSSGLCPSVIGNTIPYSDTNHVSLAYSFELSDSLREALALA